MTTDRTTDRRIDDWLQSGVVALTGFVPPGSAATVASRWTAEFAALSAALGTPVRVDGAQLLAERAALGEAQPPTGAVSVGGACRLLPCARGWIAVSLPRPSDLDLLPALVEGPVRDPWAAVRAWAERRCGADIVARVRMLGLAIGRVGEGAAPLQLPDPPGETVAGWCKPPLVVDFSALWAGPLCSSLLGLAGARVVKVESAARLDGARGGDRHFYDLLHAGQESICVDPQRPADRAALAALVAEADVVVEASRPRALEGWGLSAADAARNGTAWVGDDVAAAAGLVGWPRGEANAPAFVGDAIADPLTGIAAAVATLRAMASGRGQVIDLAMASVVAATLDDSPAVYGHGLNPAPPTARPVGGKARTAGADTARILAELVA
jgi:hypothetical protein